MKKSYNLERITKLTELYGTSDGEELIKAMKQDVSAVSKLLKRQRKEAKYNGLDYARIGTDNWK